MSGTNFLVDTNILIYLLSGDSKLKDFLQESILHVSFISQIELLAKPQLRGEEEESLIKLLEYCTVHQSTESINDLAIEVRRQSGLKVPDAIIAATSIYLGIPVVSSDSDLGRVDNLDFIHYNINL